MNGKTTLKILVDLVMAVLFGLLLWSNGTGLFFHEVAGIGMGILFLFHIALNRKPVKSLIRAAAQGSISPKGTLLLISDLLLAFGMALDILSGVLISRVLFNIHPGISESLLFLIHRASSYVCLVILTVHLAAHAGYLKKAAGQIAVHRRDAGVRKTAARFAAAAMAVGVLYFYAFSAYKNNSAAIYNSTAAASSAASSSQTTQSGSKKEDEGVSTSSSDTQAAPVSLSDYLSKLYCTGCHNHCPLSSPRCGRSYQQIQEATQEYKELYTSGS